MRLADCLRENSSYVSGIVLIDQLPALESMSSDQGPVVGQSEEAWAYIARLGAGRNGPNLHVPEAERAQGRHRHRILVEAGGDTQRVLEWKPEATQAETERS